MDAIAHVLKHSDRKVRAFIIGEGETKADLMAYVEALQLPYSLGTEPKAVICFTSWIKKVDVALLGLDLVCLSSKNEGTPVSLIEAQAASKFIVTTNVGGIKDILHPECGLLSEKDDKKGFLSNLLYAVTHFEELNKRAGVASLQILKSFSYNRLCDDMVKLYTELKVHLDAKK